MANQDPTYIIGSPYFVYAAVVGATPPNVDVLPSAAWFLLGAFENQTDKGVTLSTSQDVNEIFGQATAPVKAFRVKEGAKVSFGLMDLRLEALQFALNGNPLSNNAQSANAAGFKEIGLYRGPDISYLALLIRGATPYSSDANGYMQLWLPKVYQSGDLKITYTKGNAAVLDLEFSTMLNPYATSEKNKLGLLQAYTTAANS